MYHKKNFARSITTNNPLAIGGTSLGVTTGHGVKFPDVGAGNLFMGVIWGAAFGSPEADVDREIVEAYQASTDTFTIVRAKETTSAKEWPVGSNFMLTATSGVFNEYDASLAAAVTTPDDADLAGIWVGGILKKLTWANLKATLKTYFDTLYRPVALTAFSDLQLATGQMINGKIVVTVASNNLTLALKGADGNDPSASNPVYCKIGGVIRSVTAALSVTKNAATNWCNAGSTELSTKEIDYFAYIGYNATDGVVLGFSRFPGANQYSDFSTTTTNEKYCAISTISNAAATDYYNVIGRFAATLSAGADYVWSVPTFTANNLIQRPIYETRWLTWVPTYAWTAGTAPTGAGSSAYNKYMLNGKKCHVVVNRSSMTAGATVTRAQISVPPMALAAGNDLSPVHGYIGVWDVQNTTEAFIFQGSYFQLNCTSCAATAIQLNAEYEI